MNIPECSSKVFF